MSEIRELLNEEIKSQIKDLASLATGSKEKSSAVDDLANLYRLSIEETKLELDAEEKSERRRIDENESQDRLINWKHDDAFRNAQLDEQVKARYFNLGITAAELILPLAFYAVWMKRGFKFEETGAFTSTTFRNLFNQFKPKKK